MKRIPDADCMVRAAAWIAQRPDVPAGLVHELLGELAARGDAIGHLAAGWRPSRDEGGRRWVRRQRGRDENERMEPRTQEVMYR